MAVTMTVALQLGPRGMRWRCRIERESREGVGPGCSLCVAGYGPSAALALANALVGVTEGRW